MPGVIPDDGEAQILNIALGKVASESIELRLYTNNKVPALADVTANYTEMTGQGYAKKTLAAAAWTVTPADTGTNTPAKGTTAAQVFTFSIAGGPTPVYGYYLVGVTSGKLWGAESFADGPYSVANAGDEITITPTLRLRSEFP
jgi:hypothetical protein